VVVTVIVISALIFAGAGYVLGANRIPPQSARAIAAGFALIFIAGVATHRVLERRPDAAAIALVDTAVKVREPNVIDSGIPVSPLALHSFSIRGPKTAGSVDVVEVTKARKLHVRGWALTGSGRPATTLVAIIDHVKRVDITNIYGQSRPDVEIALKNPLARASGFDGIVPLRGVTPGAHLVEIVVASAESTSFEYPPNASRAFSLR